MTTPEQLAKWTATFEEWFATQLTVAGIPRHIQQGYALHGYLRRCQETEQAIKDARKQVIEDCANFAKDWAMEHVIEDDATLAVGDYITKSMEALND